MLPRYRRLRTHLLGIGLGSAIGTGTLAEGTRPVPEAVNCPPTLHVLTVPPGIPGWTAVDTSPGPRPLESMVVRTSPGSPSGVPHSSLLRLEQGQRRTIQANWDLAEIRRNNDRLWLACLYSGTGFALVRALPDELSQCEFRMESTGDSLQESAGCR